MSALDVRRVDDQPAVQSTTGSPATELKSRSRVTKVAPSADAVAAIHRSFSSSARPRSSRALDRGVRVARGLGYGLASDRGEQRRCLVRQCFAAAARRQTRQPLQDLSTHDRADHDFVVGAEGCELGLDARRLPHEVRECVGVEEEDHPSYVRRSRYRTARRRV